MSTSGECFVLAHYEAIGRCTRAMLDHARASDWDRLVALQMEYVQAVQELAAAEPGVALSAPALRYKATLLTEIRAAETEVRARLQARLDELSADIGVAKRQRDAVRAYGLASRN